MTFTHLRNEIPGDVFRAMVVAVAALVAFLGLPWLLVACRAADLPGWLYGAEPLLGWMRLWALLPAWLMLIASVALAYAAMRSNET